MLRTEGWRREGTLALATAVIVVLGSWLQSDDTLAPPPAAAYVVALVSSAALLLRHRAPLATMAVTTACGMLVAPLGLLPTPLTVAPVVIGAYAFAARAGHAAFTERRTTLVVLASAVLLVALTPVVEGDLSWADASRLTVVAASPLVAAIAGRAARHRRAYLALVEERALRAEESRESEARRRVVEERVRIARELHDLVAHEITLANAQAAVASHLFDDRPDEARASVDQVIRTTRHALDQLRATVGLLRQPDDGPATEPAPGLAQLPILAESVRRAGLAVSVEHEGAPASLPRGVDLTAYRIVQEALTNVTKHAAARRAVVRLAWGSEHLRLTVTDDGIGPRTPPEGRGFGLVGMRERAAAVGGALTATGGSEGGFVVTADLPLPAEETEGRAAEGATTGGAR